MNLADFFTKSLEPSHFHTFKDLIMNTSEELRNHWREIGIEKRKRIEHDTRKMLDKVGRSQSRDTHAKGSDEIFSDQQANQAEPMVSELGPSNMKSMKQKSIHEAEKYARRASIDFPRNVRLR